MAQTYSNTDAGAINGTISCAGTARLTRTFSVPNIGTVTDVDFGFLANHSWRGDIGATLSHNGVSVDMFNLQIGGAGNVDNYNVLLDDSAAELINTGANNVAHSVTVAPFQFDARPNNALSAFNGIDASGDWTRQRPFAGNIRLHNRRFDTGRAILAIAHGFHNCRTNSDNDYRFRHSRIWRSGHAIQRI